MDGINRAWFLTVKPPKGGRYAYRLPRHPADMDIGRAKKTGRKVTSRGRLGMGQGCRTARVLVH